MRDALRLTSIASVISIITLNTVSSQEQDPSTIRMLSFDQENVASVQASPSCKKGVCPGLGNVFYLPSINALSVKTGGRIFLTNRKLGECAILSTIEEHTETLGTAESMQQFVQQAMSEVDLAGSYKTKTLTANGTAQFITGHSSEITSKFNSSHVDLTFERYAIDIQQNKECFGAKNIEPDFLERFESLALLDGNAVSNPSNWTPYVQFLQDQGSHIMMQQTLGSRLQQWHSSTSEASDVQNTLQAKACADVEGYDEPETGWSAQACAAYTEEEKRQSQKLVTNKQKIILGGTRKTRNALSDKWNKKTIRAFIDSAEKSDQAVRFFFKPIWDVLISIYTTHCAADGSGSPSCENLQRAFTLQAAYEGWMAVGCSLQKTRNNVVYQAMAIAGTTSQGIHTYKCVAEKTGCRNSDADCHGGNGLHKKVYCYCHGPSCFRKEETIPGTNLVRTGIRGDQSGAHNEGINNSCSMKWATCQCDRNWSGGLPDRTLYLQSTGF